MSTSTTRAAVLAHVTAVLDELSQHAAGGSRRGPGPAGVPGGEPGPAAGAPAPEAAAGTDVSAAVAEINRLTSPAEVADYLERERFTVPVLREIARALGPTVSGAGRNQDDLSRDIVEGTAGLRIRSAAMSGGAWS